MECEQSPCHSRQQPGKVGLRHAQWQLSDILTIERQDIEGVELDLGIVLAGMPAVEIRDAIDAKQHGLPSMTNDPDLLRSADSTAQTGNNRRSPHLRIATLNFCN
jgi:hypothetical protein